ncbi:MAG: hypothetical protein BGO88_08920 [Flavobacterium sp. 38-13]|uniref:hypothetical protein n=1 Tax=Flavobacterium sp. 38-13 TaxID=1896168 RepID=UPI000967831D|nr:hypothetical protein [Flavobacterium sp. 38-13]OJX49862.1 MAG: hypothetical protein BGO88_08920 [Flavobacterium sp. 38-13]
MKLIDIPYYVKFIFSCDSNDECFSTTDSEMMKFIVNASNKESISRLEIGQKIQFEPIARNPKVYEITNITIRHLFDDTDSHKYGFDSEDCEYNQGENKEWLFSILIKTEIK